MVAKATRFPWGIATTSKKVRQNVQENAVAYDESPEAARAFHSALEFAKLTGSELTIMTVIERLPVYVSYVSAVAPDVPQILQQEKQTFYAELHHKARQTAEQAGVSVKFSTR